MIDDVKIRKRAKELFDEMPYSDDAMEWSTWKTAFTLGYYQSITDNAWERLDKALDESRKKHNLNKLSEEILNIITMYQKMPTDVQERFREDLAELAHNF